MTCLRMLAIALMVVLPTTRSWAQTSLPPGFQESIVLRGLQVPTVVAFASDKLIANRAVDEFYHRVVSQVQTVGGLPDCEALPPVARLDSED